VPFARLSIRHVKIVYCVCLSVLEIIPTANGSVEAVNTLAGAGILNFLNIYIHRPLLMLLIILLIILGFGVEFPQLYINYSYPNCLFAGLPILADVIGIMCCRVLKETDFKIALTRHLLSWRTCLKQINI